MNDQKILVVDLSWQQLLAEQQIIIHAPINSLQIVASN